MSDVFGENTEQDLSKLSTDDLLRAIIDGQEKHRAEVAQLRREIDEKKPPAPLPTGQVKSQEQLLEERIAEVRGYSHYCPGCGALSKYPRQCFGKPEAGHPAIEMVGTEELLNGDPSQHTPAPHTDKLG